MSFKGNFLLECSRRLGMSINQLEDEIRSVVNSDHNPQEIVNRFNLPLAILYMFKEKRNGKKNKEN